MPPTLLTQRLILRPLLPGDAHSLHRIYQVESILRYFPTPVPPPLEKVQRYIAGQQASWEKYGYAHWAVLPTGQAQLAGWAGLQFLPETGETEVGYLLDRPFWRLGYATEAARAALQFGFDRFGFDRIIALVHPENLASRRVIEKCGMGWIDRKVYFGIELLRYWIERAAFEKQVAAWPAYRLEPSAP